EWVWSSATIDVTAEGSVTSDEALALLTADNGRPSGSPQVESETDGNVVYLFTDPEGHRLGRVGVTLMPNGWFVGSTERCGG
ncbi:MAG: hypothetical protein H6Q11_1061, partial [Acidobacteria bacterium]|nr:hypothetical protein [Acidobacteriota bacterium]